MGTTTNTLLQVGFTMNNAFNTYGYIKVEGMVEEKTIQTISLYFENKIKRGEWVSKKVEGTRDASKLGYYADPLIEVMLKQCLPLIEEQTGLELEPTYSFSRVYQEGEQLIPHTDRPSCEVSVTINVACTGDTWPIWMQYEDKDSVKCMLEPGDAVIYRGCEVTHWRRKLPKGDINVQFMLHYVDKNGQNSEYKFDRREALGLASSVLRS
jgi:alkylated DNA repair dioxygenase AlkB